MNRSLVFAFLLTVACDKEQPTGKFAQLPAKVESPDGVITLENTSDPAGVICLRMDQLAINRAALKQVGGRSVAGLMVDVSPRQAEEYARTGKLPASNKIEEHERRKDMFDRMMDVSDITGAANCFDSEIEECIESGGRGQMCFDMAEKECARFNLKKNKSHCERMKER